MLQNILHLNVSAAELEEPSPKQPFSTPAVPQEAAYLGRALRAAGSWSCPSMGNPRSCHVSILSDQAALGLLCLVNHGHWEMHKPFLTQDQSAEAETPVCLQRMKICFLGEVKERCALKQNIGRILLSAGTEEAPDTKWSSWGEGPSGAHPRGGLQCELSGRPEGPWDRSSAQPRRGQT